jgi:hypothetical protein
LQQKEQQLKVADDMKELDYDELVIGYSADG